MATARSVAGDRPDMQLLERIPEAPHPWAMQPGATWLQLHPSTRGMSQLVNHISNIEIVRWIDRAAEMALSHAGWSYQDLLDTGSMFFVARHEIDYRSEALLDESFFITTWVRDIRRVKSWRDTLIWAMRDGAPEIVCTASTLWVHVDLNTRKPTRIPHDMSEALNPLQHEQSPWRARG